MQSQHLSEEQDGFGSGLLCTSHNLSSRGQVGMQAVKAPNLAALWRAPPHQASSGRAGIEMVAPKKTFPSTRRYLASVMMFIKRSQNPAKSV